jgi:SAM-dependent methyltransferase
MKILDEGVRSDLASGRQIGLDLGSGGPGRAGFYGVDLLELPGVSIQANLNEPLSLLPDNSVSGLKSSHCLEHVNEFVGLMKELHRVVCPGGLIEITVPHFSNPHGYSDPTHVRFFGLYTFNYFMPTSKQQPRRVPNYFPEIRFNIEQIYIDLMPRSFLDRVRHPGLFRSLNSSFANQDKWEQKLCWKLPGNEITYWLRPEK